MLLRLPRILVFDRGPEQQAELSPFEAAKILWQTTYKLLRACALALGPDHLMTRAFETALIAKDPTLMRRAAVLLDESPPAVRERVLVVLQRM